MRDLAVVVREHVALAAVQHADPAGAERGGVSAGRDALARRLDADQPDAGVADERREQPDGVRAAADSRDARIRQPVGGGQHLCARLAADHTLQIAHHPRVRIAARLGTERRLSGPDVQVLDGDFARAPLLHPLWPGPFVAQSMRQSPEQNEPLHISPE